MPEIELLRPGHAPALLAFEQENRAYFAASIPDRGDDYFARFDERHRALLAEQEAGVCYFHVLVGAEGDVLGRINLVDVADGGADLGYRIAERAAGRGLATWAVRTLCGLAANRYGLTTLRAGARLDNAASRAVLTRSGFAVVGERQFSGRPGLSYLRDLAEFVAPPPGAPPTVRRGGPAHHPEPEDNGPRRSDIAHTPKGWRSPWLSTRTRPSYARVTTPSRAVTWTHCAA